MRSETHATSWPPSVVWIVWTLRGISQKSKSSKCSPSDFSFSTLFLRVPLWQSNIAKVFQPTPEGILITNHFEIYHLMVEFPIGELYVWFTAFNEQTWNEAIFWVDIPKSRPEIFWTSCCIPSKAGFSILRLWKTENSYQPPRFSKDICFQIPINRLKKIPIKKKNDDLNK